MGFFEASFEIIEEKNCPMYGRGDWFHLSGLAFSPPKGKPSCLFLAREVTEYMIKKIGEEHFAPKNEGRSSFNCSGCTGLVKFKIKKKGDEQYATMHMRMLAASESKPGSSDIESLSSQLSSLSLFEVIDEKSLIDLITHLKILEFAPEKYVIKKGEESNFLYMILSGKVEVVIDGNTIACLGRGEMFGEMSLLTGKPVGASIKVVEPSKIISISNDQFRQILIKYPSIQMGVTKILAQRLNYSNRLTAVESDSALSGQLADIPTAEFCQLINSNVKTGVVSIALSSGEGRLCFNKGELVEAIYNSMEGEDAFFALLKEKRGSFNFVAGLSDAEKTQPPMGSFMGLLMEGLQKFDEEKAVEKLSLDED